MRTGRFYTHTKASYVQQGGPLTTAQAGGMLGVDVRVSRDGKVVAAGANQLNNYVGGVFVWRLVKGTWTPMGAPILPTTVGAFALFGTNLGIDKMAPIANNGAGTVLIYRWSKQAQAWALATQVQSDVVTSNTAFGAGVAMTWSAKYVGKLSRGCNATVMPICLTHPRFVSSCPLPRQSVPASSIGTSTTLPVARFLPKSSVRW